MVSSFELNLLDSDASSGTEGDLTVLGEGVSDDAGDDGFLDFEIDEKTAEALDFDPSGNTLAGADQSEFSIDVSAASLNSLVQETAFGVDGIVGVEEGRTWDAEILEAHQEDEVAKILLKYAEENEKPLKIYHPDDRPGGRLITEGERAEGCYLVAKGSDPIDIKKTVRHPRGDIKIRVDQLGKKGDGYPALLGEIGIVAAPGLRTADAVMTGPTQVYEFTTQEILEISQKHPEIIERMKGIGALRLEEQIRLASRAEDAILAAEDKKAYSTLKQAFDYDKAFVALQATAQRPLELTTVELKGQNRSTGEVRREAFRIVLNNAPDGGPSDLYFEVYNQEHCVADFTLKAPGNELEVGYTKLEDAKIEGYGFVSQIYRPAFEKVDTIESNIIEDRTVEYYSRASNSWSDTEFAPSAFSANSPVLAARKGTVSKVLKETVAGVKVMSYRVEKPIEDLLYMLTQIERSIVDPEADNYRSLGDMYGDLEPLDMVNFADEQLNRYLQDDPSIDEEVEKLLRLQIDRNVYLRRVLA